MKFRTQYTRIPATTENNSSPSQTIPNEAMSIREILVRYARGLPINGSRVPIYDEENDLPDPRKMDLADWEALREQYKDELDQIRERYNQAKKNQEAPAGGPPLAGVEQS